MYEQILIEKFNEIRDLGWITSNFPLTRHYDNCLGDTFEALVGKPVDNVSVADFHGIEFKSHRTVTNSMVTLFSKSPSYPKRANTFLRTNYGVYEETYNSMILNTTVFGNRENTHRGGYGFKVIVDRQNENIRLFIRDLNTGIIVNNDVYWSFTVIENAIKRKLDTIAILYGEEMPDYNSNKWLVRYTNMSLIKQITLDKMLKSIEDGRLAIDIRIGVYASGKNAGKTHDHGTAFRMNLQDLLTLYGNVENY